MSETETMYGKYKLYGLAEAAMRNLGWTIGERTPHGFYVSRNVLDVLKQKNNEFASFTQAFVVVRFYDGAPVLQRYMVENSCWSSHEHTGLPVIMFTNGAAPDVYRRHYEAQPHVLKIMDRSSIMEAAANDIDLYDDAMSILRSY